MSSRPMDGLWRPRFERHSDAAGIGDVKEAERKAFVYSEEIAHLDKKLKDAEHRAETLEHAFRDFLAEYLTAVNEANSYGCGIPEMSGWYASVLPYEDKVTNMLNECLQQAEKELAEESKDD